MKSQDQSYEYPWAQPVRHNHRWLLAGVMVLVIATGWRYPVFGFVVPVAMLTGILGSLLRGRYVCGNICPRGSFYDTAFRFVGGSRPIPPLLRSPLFRWLFMALLMTALALQIAQKPHDPLHWGFVFWTACAVTTALGIILGTIYRARTWCSFCPVGTIASALGGKKYQLQIADHCRRCAACEKSCPMGFSISAHSGAGALSEKDCLKCSSCTAACPVGALSWPQEGS
ncbi:4Fe-4S binding protein [Geobacter sp. DSM 9736]|uniref:4Fe-4S binding protein n=1 Tax=Geobacter sp. DSM 9736 TaxID=1277350 RepID=UPI000B5E3C26|nr:4Fe-4S binding protein [Geobacter sp. DSM 9736]SNB44990.1 4Fe-4S binding domain-containing protein [Geobacter sp. DSM 9736]